MTKEYLKMADVFPSEMRVGGDSDNLIIDDVGIIIGCYSGDKMAEHVLHAINSHDELVAEVERLRESLKHANANYELFERQYYLEKDAHEQLQADVAELRHEISMVSNVLDEVDLVVTERIKNGAYDLDDIAGEVSQAIDRINRVGD